MASAVPRTATGTAPRCRLCLQYQASARALARQRHRYRPWRVSPCKAAPHSAEESNACLKGYERGRVSSCGRWLIRTLRDEDILAAVEIQSEAFHAEHTLPPVQSAFKAFFRAEVLNALRGKLKGQPGTFAILVAVPAEAAAHSPIGIIEVYQDGSPQTRASMEAGQEEVGVGWLGSMAVSDSYRRQGVGKALIEACEAVVLSWCFKRTALHVFQDNAAAIQMYQHCGFEQLGIEDTMWPYWMQRRQKVLMAKVH